MKKILPFLFMLCLLSGCYNPKTHGKFISEHQDAWIDGYAVLFSEHEKVDKGLLYCRANVEKDGSAKPVCYSAKFKE
jgi:hypothetical protein